MRKKLTERKVPLELHDVTDDAEGVLPYVRVTASPDEVFFRTRTADETTYNAAFQLRDEAAVRELRDQLDAWLDDHGEDGDA